MTEQTTSSERKAVAGSERDDVVLRVEKLSTSFRTGHGLVNAVQNVSFNLHRGESLGIVGESGCGKSVTSKSIMRLLPDHVTQYGKDSRVMLGNDNLIDFTERQMRDVRGDRIGMIFQEPMTALNPVFTIGWQIDEALRHHTKLNRAGRRKRAIEMLRMVDMPSAERRYDEYPHQLSGGMRQRVLIAMALCCEPEILIADEPTTALDVTIQAQILKLMKDLSERTGTAVLLITHDLGVIAQTCDRVVVMYAGEVVETASVHDLFHNAAHPYTKALLDSIPRSGRKKQGQKLQTIPGLVPALTEMPDGCRFAERCTKREEQCVAEHPALRYFGDERDIRCHFPLIDIGSVSASSE